MSQNNIDQGQAAETPTQETKTFIRQVRAATRRKYAPEDKIRIVLEGFRREVTVSDLCRREGINPGVFYAWAKEFKEFMERASHPGYGERRHPSGDRTPQAGEPRSKAAGCRPFPGGQPLQKNGHPSFRRGPAHERPGDVERHNPGGSDPVGKQEPNPLSLSLHSLGPSPARPQ